MYGLHTLEFLLALIRGRRLPTEGATPLGASLLPVILETRATDDRSAATHDRVVWIVMADLTHLLSLLVLKLADLRVRLVQLLLQVLDLCILLVDDLPRLLLDLLRLLLDLLRLILDRAKLALLLLELRNRGLGQRFSELQLGDLRLLRRVQKQTLFNLLAHGLFFKAHGLHAFRDGADA